MPRHAACPLGTQGHKVSLNRIDRLSPPVQCIRLSDFVQALLSLHGSKALRAERHDVDPEHNQKRPRVGWEGILPKFGSRNGLSVWG